MGALALLWVLSPGAPLGSQSEDQRDTPFRAWGGEK